MKVSVSEGAVPVAAPVSAAVGHGRMPLIDALKAVASQMIVLHHLAFYGPMTDWTQLLAPGTVEWFSRHARMAVQVFLVVSGFLAVRALAPLGHLQAVNPGALLRKRYISIALPYVVALLVAVGANELASQWMTHSSLSTAAPDLWQFVAHALLLHGLLEMESLSAGVWYVAIDFQLYALLLAVLWLGQRWAAGPPRPTLPRQPWAAPGLVVTVAAASLLLFNRDSGWDEWGVYFFGAYALGGLAWWTCQPHARGWPLAGVVGLVGLALVVDFRERVALAAAVALLLGVSHARGWLYRWPRNPGVAYLGRISYGVFLMNFPVALVVNAWFTRFAPADPWVQTAGVGVAWLACGLAGAAFHHWVEAPLRRWRF